MSLNRSQLIGFLGSNPTLRTVGDQPVTNLRVATSRTWTEKGGAKHTETEWHDVEVWGRTAEACAKFLAKGSRVYVDGRLKTDKWKDKETGADRYRVKIIASDVQFLDRKPTASDEEEAPTEPEEEMPAY